MPFKTMPEAQDQHAAYKAQNQEISHQDNPPFELLTASDLSELHQTEWRIQHVLPRTGCGALFGGPGSGKTFEALHLAVHLSNGLQWFGFKTNPCPVVYVALEGEGGLAKRIRAIKLRYGVITDKVRFVVQPFNLLNPGMVEELAEIIIKCGFNNGLVIIDTLNRATPGCDENSSVDMGLIISSTKKLQQLTGGFVLLVHHSGKDTSKGLRGHSSLHGALDVAIEVSRNGDSREWKLFKAKDGEDGIAHPFRLEVVETGIDEDGEPITSCVVAEDKSAEYVKKVKLPQGDTQKIVYEAIGELLRKSTKFGMYGAPEYRPCIELEPSVITISTKLSCRPDQRIYQTRRTINAMQSKDIFEINEGWLWLK